MVVSKGGKADRQHMELMKELFGHRIMKSVQRKVDKSLERRR